MRNVGAIESYPLRRYLLDQSRGRLRHYVNFIYQIEVTVSALSTDTAGTVDTDADAPFLWSRTLGVTYNPAAPFAWSPNPFGTERSTVLLRIGGAGSPALSNQPIHWGGFVGCRPTPAMLDTPLLIPAGAQLHATINKWAGNPNPPLVFVIQFIGCKVYGWGPRNAAAQIVN